jgi:hypothetical protein
MHEAKLFATWAGGQAGYVYDVVYRDEVIVRRSRDPEFDAARILHGRGLVGWLQVLDGVTGRPRLRLGLQNGSKLKTREDRGRGPKLERWKPLPTRVLPIWRAGAARRDGS